MATFFYDLHGHPVAFRRQPDDRFLFDKQGYWIGWFPWGDNDAVDKSGKYLGTVVGDRFLERAAQPYRGYPGYPGYPGYAGYPGYPGFAGFAGYKAGFADIPATKLKG